MDIRQRRDTRMNAADRFVEEYKKAQGNKPASPLLTEAARHYVLVAKGMGVGQGEIIDALVSLMENAGGRTPETARLDDDLIMRCIEEYARPWDAPPES